MDLFKLLEIAKIAAKAASENILKVYESSDFAIESKEDDSPLTKADKASHSAIVEYLGTTGIPILSEEGQEVSFKERNKWEYFWLIDPLDGTKEFIKRNGEFTVNIALINKNTPVLGVVTVPVQDKLYYAIKGSGAFLEAFGETKQLRASSFSLDQAALRVVASRSHLNEETKEFMSNFKEPRIVSMGSSLKLISVAEGEADLYPRYAPTMEWDTAAAHIIVTEAGGSVTDSDGTHAIVYNKENLLNPYFLVQGKVIG